MGEVFRAWDRASGEPVAVKVLHKELAADPTRFWREAKLLAGLSHPGIVRYVAQGTTRSGAPYLVMEWLDGEDLGARLLRGMLGVEEAVTLATRVAEALAVVHARGIVHRDLKPSNLFLVEGDIARIKLLDFGIAWLPEATRMTSSGVLIGTPAYMAPEQASCDKAVDARTDVFALGCVLFECLTGKAAFTGVHFMNVLMKILLEEVPRASELRAEVQPALDELCARMLAKDPEMRPRDGSAVAAALVALGLGGTLPDDDVQQRPSALPLSSLTRNERRVRSVVLMGPEPRLEDDPVRPDAQTRLASCPREMRAQAAACAGQLDLLAGGSILVTLAGAGLATDQAAQAARCALALRPHAGDRPMALVTGRAELAGNLPASDVIERATRTLAQAEPVAGGARAEGRTPPIAIDEVTAGLLDARFEVVETEEGLWLQGEQALAKGARTLLGKPTACVGRDWEIATLEGLLAACIDESHARAALLTAPAGVGKTRIAYELLRRIQQRGEPTAVWIGRGDPLRAGAPFDLLARALSGACGIQDGEPLEVRRDKIAARVRAHVAAGDARRVAEFLGEILGTPFPDEDSVQLRAARGDARLMGDQMRRAWVDFLGAECAHEPVLLVLEDLHWGDLPTVQYVDEALRRLGDRPWMLLSLARPEVHDVFPDLWARREVQEIPLKSLSAKASARLARQVLGDDVSAEVLERLVAQANGNAFYLEELIRAAAAGSTEALPETVLAMVQSRLERLDEPSRRLLRAGSIFGKLFWRGAMQALVGDDAGVSIAKHLARLEQLEWITMHTESRFQGEQQLAFRHDLMREAAYGMLTEEDRALGHRLAGAWLERASEPSAAVIAEHFDRGGEAARAAHFYCKAAAQALAANDLDAVLARTERAKALEVSGEDRGEILLLRAEAHYRRGDLSEASSCALGAMELLPKGSALWCHAVRLAGSIVMHLMQHERLVMLADALASAWTLEDASGPMVMAMASMARSLRLGGLHEKAEALHARIEAVAERFGDDPTVSAYLHSQSAVRERLAGNFSAFRALTERALQCHERAGNLYDACLTRTNLAHAQCRLGAHADAVACLRAVIVDVERLGLDVYLGVAWQHLGFALVRLGALEEARVVESKAISFFAAQGNRRWEGISRCDLAQILCISSELEEAEAEARRAVELLEPAKAYQIGALAILAAVLLAQGRSPEALAVARKASAMLASLNTIEEGDVLTRLVHAEALRATGNHEAARAAIAEARDRLLAAAARIDDPQWRQSFLQNVPENARTLELAHAWLGEDVAWPPGG
jgi:tetratricopeptide (TPR) repeat protein